jgi:chaperonin GroEL
VRRAIQVPAKQNVLNAGDDGSIIVDKLLEKDDYAWGYNAAAGEYQDMVGNGVIDPAKVVRTALQDAASVAALLIITEALVAEKPKKDAAPVLPAGAGMDF